MVSLAVSVGECFCERMVSLGEFFGKEWPL